MHKMISGLLLTTPFFVAPVSQRADPLDLGRLDLGTQQVTIETEKVPFGEHPSLTATLSLKQPVPLGSLEVSILPSEAGGTTPEGVTVTLDGATEAFDADDVARLSLIDVPQDDKEHTLAITLRPRPNTPSTFVIRFQVSRHLDILGDFRLDDVQVRVARRMAGGGLAGVIAGVDYTQDANARRLVALRGTFEFEGDDAPELTAVHVEWGHGQGRIPGAEVIIEGHTFRIARLDMTPGTYRDLVVFFSRRATQGYVLQLEAEFRDG